MIRLVFLLLLTSCCYSPAVRIQSEAGNGFGVALDPSQVVTVSHLARGQVLVEGKDGWRLAEVVQRSSRLTVLRVPGLLPGPSPLVGAPALGDSGFPVLNQHGQVIALIDRMENGRLICIPLKKHAPPE